MRRTLKIANSVRANETVGELIAQKVQKIESQRYLEKEKGWNNEKEHKAEIGRDLDGREKTRRSKLLEVYNFIFCITNLYRFYLCLAFSVKFIYLYLDK